MQVKTKNLMVGGLVVLLALLLWYKMLYSPTASQASKAHTAEQTALAQEKTLQTQLNTANAPGAKKPKPGEASAQDLNVALPSTPQLSELLRNIDRIFASTGVAWQSVTPATPTAAGDLASSTLGITVSGSYDQVHSYVSQLLALKRMIVVDTVNISVGGGSSSPAPSNGAPTGKVFAGSGAAPVLTAQISGRLFSQGTVVAPAPGSAAARQPAATQSTGTQSG